jgi:uncharacterized protein
VPQFSWSAKSTIVNPKNVYTIDTGFVRANSLSDMKDYGRLLKNVVFLVSKRNSQMINYFKGKGEGDFVALKSKQLAGVDEVCTDLNADNNNREIGGLTEVMEFFNLGDGTILTLNQED